VSFEGTFEDGMKVCLHARVAMRVLLQVASFGATNADGLYEGTRAVDWSEWLSAKSTLSVSATTRDNVDVHHSGFAALKVKDAVVDALRDRLGARPNVAPQDPDVSLVLHLRGTEARLYLDMAGEALHRRGYRVAMTEAPLKETLAAAVLALGGIAPGVPFVDPMTGSGTLAIEHALAARKIAPGITRRFGFERWPHFSQHAAWKSLKEAARAAVLPAAPSSILARDVSRPAVDAARRNAEAAGVISDIRFEVGDARDLSVPGPPGNVCVNPPYGERLSDPDLGGLYRDLARTFGQMRGWQVVVLCANPELSRAMKRKPQVSHKMWNGPLEARLLRFSI
jgi:putative N6-adenine-specific DNA methylase